MADRNVDGIILSAEEAEKATQAALNEIEQISGSVHDFQFHKITVEKDGEFIEIEVPMDDIDLLDDYEDDDLSSEGMRSLNLIDKDHDSTTGEAEVKGSRNKIPFGEIKVGDNGEYEIICPHTKSTEVYQISSGVFASYETDQPFRIDFNLADNIPDHSWSGSSIIFPHDSK